MRVLQVITSLGKGGAERVVIELSNGLINKGIDVEILLMTRVNFELNRLSLHGNVKVIHLSTKIKSKIICYVNGTFWILKNRKVLSSYDVVHCHLTFGLFFGFQLYILQKLKFISKLKLIATYHAVGTKQPMPISFLSKKVSRYFNFFSLVSKDEHWEKLLTSNKYFNFVFIPNGISNFNLPDKTKVQNREEILVIGTISRLVSERNPLIYVEIIAEIEKILPNRIKLLIGGEGPEKEDLIKYSKKRGVGDKIELLGLIEDPDRFLQEIDLYIALNVREVTGIAGLEAISNNVPVIGYQLCKSYTSGDQDWIWSNSSPKKIAEKIIEFYENPILKTKNASLQKIKAKEMFSSKAMIDAYLRLYLK
jgi:glycosyltransferase involved in cell wall biosynthesis